MKEIEKWAAEWHLKRYGINIDPFRTMTKLTEEVGELAKALIKQDKQNAIEEVADVAIVLLHICRYLDISIIDAINLKRPTLEERLKKKQQQ
jgi:NTP pyrophosphatase (non-canonical NTP hydrolase)